MPTPTQPTLEAGRVYRTRKLSRWSAKAPRLAKRLVAEGALLPLAHGLFAVPRRGRFGAVPPTDEALMRAFLENTPFVFTGPPQWNALGLGTSALSTDMLVYNTKRSGRFVLGERPFVLRRVAFPQPAPPEWFVVDLLEHADQAASSPAMLAPVLVEALRRGNFHLDTLRQMAARYGTRATQGVVADALQKRAA